MTDTQGNKAVTLTRKVTVADTTVPVVTLTGSADQTIQAGSTFNDAGATAVDGFVGDLTSKIVITGSVDASSPGEYTLTYTATDSSDNDGTTNRKVTVVDTVAPVITLLGDSEVTHEGGTDYTDAGAVVTDSGDPEIELNVTNPVDASKLGEYTLTFDATDASGNKATQVLRKVTVVDTTAPILALDGLANVSHFLGKTFTDPGYSAVDAVEGDLSASVVVGGDTIDVDTLGSYTLTYDVTDSQGNKATQLTRKVIVTDAPDTTAPVITLNGEAEMTAEAGQAYTDLGAVAADDRDGVITATMTVVGSVDTSKLGVYTLKYNVSDSAGNAASEVVRTVTVVDTLAPVITLVGEADFAAEAGVVYVDAGASAADIFDGDLTESISTTSTVDTNKLGEYSVTYEAVDAAGNKGSSTRKVTVADTLAPVITLKGEASVNVEAGDVYIDAGATAADISRATSPTVLLLQVLSILRSLAPTSSHTMLVTSPAIVQQQSFEQLSSETVRFQLSLLMVRPRLLPKPVALTPMTVLLPAILWMAT